MIGILWKNKNEAKFIVLLLLASVCAIFGLNELMLSILYNMIKHYKFEYGYYWTIAIVPLALGMAWLNVRLLTDILNRKCYKCNKRISYWNINKNIKVTSMICGFISFINVFALLREQPNEYIKNYSALIIIFVFFIEKLLLTDGKHK